MILWAIKIFTMTAVNQTAEELGVDDHRQF